MKKPGLFLSFIPIIFLVAMITLGV
ncbi:MAG: hypothetical protein ACD_77C00204G0001, partial [uncultured bacterium]